MRKFHFPLETALRLGERAVEAAEAALRRTQGELHANLQAQQDLTEGVRQAQRDLQEGPLDAADLTAMARYRDSAVRRKLRLGEEARRIAGRAQEQQARWQEAERNRTLLARLREKALVRWQHEYDKEQQQLAEESYLSRWGRRS